MSQAIEPPVGAPATTDESRRGIFFLCAGIFIFSFQDVIIKLLSDTFPVHEIVFLRGLIALPLLLLIVHFDSGFHTLRTEKPLLHVVRSIAMFGAYLFYYLAVAAIPLTTAIALFFTAPLMITALSVPFLGEKVGYRRWIALLIGFGGVLVMLRPGIGTIEPAMLLALLSALSYALSQIMARRLGVTDSASVMSFYSGMAFMYMGAIMGYALAGSTLTPDTYPSLAFLLRPWSMPSGLELAMLCTIGVITAMGFYCLSQAYRLAPAPTVAPFEYTALFWVAVLSLALWGEVPDMYTLAGVGLIVLGGLYVLRRERTRSDRPLTGRGIFRGR